MEQPHRSARERYLKSAQPLLAALAARGVHVHQVSELRRHGARAAEFVEPLLETLASTDDPQLLQELSSVLAAPWARERALAPLLARLRSTQNSERATKMALASAVAALSDASALEALLEFVPRRSHGQAREPLVVALGRLDDPRAFDALVALLDDNLVGGHALGALLEHCARNRRRLDPQLVKPFLRDGRAWVRRQAKDLLQIIDQLS